MLVRRQGLEPRTRGLRGAAPIGAAFAAQRQFTWRFAAAECHVMSSGTETVDHASITPTGMHHHPAMTRTEFS
jgi:hypothetical protein